MKRSFDLSTNVRNNSPSDSPLLQEQLADLPIFRDESSAEQFVDSTAAKLGLPVRVESVWHQLRLRKLAYEDTDSRLTLTVTIAPGPVVEGKPSWCFAGSVKHNRKGVQIKLPNRLRPRQFARDAAQILSKLRRG